MDALLAVSLTRGDPPLAEQVAEAVRAGAELIELRVDCIRDDGAVEALLQQPRAVPFILTARRAEEGGAWDDDEDRRIGLLERLGRYRPGFIDVEHAVWQRSAEVRRRIGSLCDLDQARAGGARNPKSAPAGSRNRLILSCHDLRGTPADLEKVFDCLEASPAEVVKAVFTAGDALDSCRVLAQLRRRGGSRATIALAMGEAGLMTRVLARKFGGLLTFAALERGAESAPGQPPIAELREIYRWDAIRAGTRVFGVIGWPVTHSLSPRVHNAAMAAEGIDGVYLPLPVRPTYQDLAGFLDYVTDADWLDLAGISVTMPHKEWVARWLQERGYRVGALARRCEAVNTLVRARGGGWEGENTDGPGALSVLETVPELAQGGLDGQTVDLLGAGGVARAVAAALVERNCQVTIFNRSEQRARALAQQLRCDWKSWERRSSGSGRVLINCTSVGMVPDIQSSPVPTQRLRPGTVVFDTVYNPARTKLLREARARGRRAVGGVELFIGQAAEQFALWHGGSAPRGALRAGL